MKEEIDNLFELENILNNNLLKDHTTEKNIVWATNMYSMYGYQKNNQMLVDEINYLFKNNLLVPRILRSKDQQQERSRDKGEVFTPSWIINKMNNCCDEKWFNQKEIFNIENEDNSWTTKEDKIKFNKKDGWKDYVYSKRIEITCGEAPYIVSRYDVTTGNKLALKDRIGILDRKLRIVSENTETQKSWLQWTYKAFESVYGYEYQGDSLLIARINLVQTFVEYFYDKFGKKPEKRMIDKIIKIVSWNFWQMDGLQNSSPIGAPKEKFEQLTLEALFNDDVTNSKKETFYCKIKDWRTNTIIEYKNIKKEDD